MPKRQFTPRDGLPELLPPSMDIVFKRLFGDERNKDILADLLTEIFGFKITQDSITLTDPHLKRDYPKDKLGILDVKLKLADKTIVNVEMQVGNLKNIRKRLEYYISNMMTEQLKESDEYAALVPVVMIVISKDKLLPETDKFHCEFGTLEKTEYFEFHRLRTIHTFELPKLPKRGNNKLVDWLTFINSKEKGEFMTLAQECKHLSRALDALENTSANAETRSLYFSRLMAIRDEKARIAYGIEKGIEEGMEKIKEKVKAEGRAEGRAEGKAEGMDKIIELIEKGLSVDEIKKIRLHEQQ
jgi:predicted transposase/invertase (TIGR01784 family)